MKEDSPISTFAEGLTLNKDLPFPLYHQLKEIVVGKIRSGELRPNDRLPAEDELATQYQVSKATVRQALSELTREGYLRRAQGLGTFVAVPKVQQGPRELTSFTQEMHKRGTQASSHVLEQDIVAADAVVAAGLRVAEGTRVFRLKRLRCADGVPMGIQTAYIPVDLAPGIVEQDFRESSLYDVLARKYSLAPARAEETHFAVLLERIEAGLLGVPDKSPGMAAERVTYLASDRPFELVHSVMRGDRYKVVLKLTTDEHG